ncbi:MAG: hypothetical protein JW993_07700 [Sedimentisphaerales bacterium]|nr:hypothetical protein [Sedimentisphaerales bacterium]
MMPGTRTLTIIAQDPSIKDANGKILKTPVRIPYENLQPGPRGYRVHVVDYDSSQRVLYRPPVVEDGFDPYARASDATLLREPAFHAQNAYAIVMRLLARFEAALGRRVPWGFGGHQIHVVPHAFAGANAYYSDDAHGLFFGYFTGQEGEPVYTCLSHDVVAHEATHALLDGLRNTYTVPSHPDQAGFHEGFSDIVALLSVFGLPDVVRALLPRAGKTGDRVRSSDLSAQSLKMTALLGLAEQFGQEVSRYRADCLRRAVARPPRPGALEDPNVQESHVRGEILSAAVLNSFVEVWTTRLKSWLPRTEQTVTVERVVEDGADAAEQLLTMCIRALDYCPVVDITFGDFLSALLTADMELLPDDGKYGYRRILREQFAQWRILPASGGPDDVKAGAVSEPGVWQPPLTREPLNYDCVHRQSLEQNLDEVFRFLWENRRLLGVYEDAYTWVISVRPCVRVGPDGFVLRETVSEYRQTLELDAGQLTRVHEGMTKPEGMPDETPVRLHGGGVLVFDEFGRLKYHVRSRIDNPIRQHARLEYLWKNGIRDRLGRYGFSDGSPKGQRFAIMHDRRDGREEKAGEWNG